MISNFINYIYSFYDPKQVKITEQHKTLALAAKPEYLGIVEPISINKLEVIKPKAKNDGEKSRLDDVNNTNELSRVCRVLQNNDPQYPIKLQYRMIKKVSKDWWCPLHKEAYFNSKANIWNLYSYLHPYELVIQDLGTDLFECKYYWQKSKAEFKHSFLKQSSKQQISASDIELELTKYDSIHRDIIRSIFRQIVKQLIDLADEGICHYDIKLSNMVVDNRGIASLIDFGLSLEQKNYNFNITDRKFINPHLAGTLSYLSPEIINHKYLSFKKESWALGLTLFWLLENNAGYVCNIGSLVEIDIKTLKFNLQNYQLIYNYIINSPCFDETSRDLLIKLLDINYETRLSIQEALNHPFFYKKESENNLHWFIYRQKLLEQLYEIEKCLLEEQETLNEEDISIFNTRINRKKRQIDEVDTFIAESSKKRNLEKLSDLETKLEDTKLDNTNENIEKITESIKYKKQEIDQIDDVLETIKNRKHVTYI